MCCGFDKNYILFAYTDEQNLQKEKEGKNYLYLIMIEATIETILRCVAAESWLSMLQEIQ